ncbi:hypothetical protein GN956_G10816 [Arapaima gigas]
MPYIFACFRVRYCPASRSAPPLRVRPHPGTGTDLRNFTRLAVETAGVGVMAASRERSALHELRSELTCPVCLELFRAPVILECGHHFCSACIARCWEARTEESAPCPQCRAPCASRPRPNSLLCNVVDSVRRAGDARPQPGSLGPESDYCEEHEEKLKLFCEEDQRPICVVCGVSRLHRAHCLLPLNEAADSYKVVRLPGRERRQVAAVSHEA